MTAPSPQRAASAEERERLREAPSFVLLKRGLFWRPDAKGYTGILSEAGRYSEEDARGHAGDGTTFMPAGEAPKFSSACWEDVKLKVVERELIEALDRITAAEARRAEGLARADEAEQWLGEAQAAIDRAEVERNGCASLAGAALGENMILRFLNERSETELAEARAYAETVSSLAGKLEADLDRITAAEARAEEAKALNRSFAEAHIVISETAQAEEACANAATADRDRLADEVARAVARLDQAAAGERQIVPANFLRFVSEIRALTVTGGTTDG